MAGLSGPLSTHMPRERRFFLDRNLVFSFGGLFINVRGRKKSSHLLLSLSLSDKILTQPFSPPVEYKTSH